MAGLSLAQIGEFSFLLSKEGVRYGLLTPEAYGLFLAVSVLTMAVTPFLIAAAPKLADLLAQKRQFNFLLRGFQRLPVDEEAPSQTRSDHLIIVGYGANGRLLAQSAKAAAIPYVVIDTNPECFAPGPSPRRMPAT